MINCRWSMILLASMLLSCGCVSDSKQMLERAKAQWRKGDYEKAIRLDMLLYERDPHGKYAAQALLNAGDIFYLNLRELNKAIETYQKLVNELPQTPQEFKAREQLAGIYTNELGDLTQAIHEYEKILGSKHLDNRVELKFQMANTYFKLNDFDAALRELRRIQEDGVSGHLSDQVSLKIGNIYLIRKRFEEALEPFQEVAKSPCIECRRRAVLNLMETHEALCEFDEAIAAIRKLDRTPDNEERIHQEVSRLTARRLRVESGDLWNLATGNKRKK